MNESVSVLVSHRENFNSKLLAADFLWQHVSPWFQNHSKTVTDRLRPAWDLLLLHSMWITMCLSWLRAGGLHACSTSLWQGRFMCITWLMGDREVFCISASKAKKSWQATSSAEQQEMEARKWSRESYTQSRSASAKWPFITTEECFFNLWHGCCVYNWAFNLVSRTQWSKTLIPRVENSFNFQSRWRKTCSDKDSSTLLLIETYNQHSVTVTSDGVWRSG